MKHTIDQIDSITRFIPTFQKDGFEFSETVEPRQSDDGYWTMGAILYSDDALAFIKACYDNEWVFPFDYATYAQTEEAQQLRDDPGKLAQATDEQLAKVLTIVIRKDRFCEGELDNAFQSGLIMGILKRAERIAADYRKQHNG
jgi:Family of unknown function (DUF6508)